MMKIKNFQHAKNLRFLSMKKIIITTIALSILVLILLAGCTVRFIEKDENKEPGPIGGERDEHGCLGPAGYAWSEEVGACIREWELDNNQKKAAKTAIAPLSYPVTIVTVVETTCSGCFEVYIQRNDNQENFKVRIIHGEIYQGEEPEACPEDAKICTDGTVLVRDPYNNCEFPDCAEPEKEYKQTDLEICKYIELKCPEGEIPFFDEKGCGCVLGEPGPRKYFCLREQDADPYACTMEYKPVCGWFNKEIKCIKYPCAATYSNSCVACQDPNVNYWTGGECPE